MTTPPPGNKLNFYDEPTELKPVATNYRSSAKSYENNKECVLIQNNDDEIATNSTIQLFAHRLAEITRTIDINCDAQEIQPYMFGHPYTKKTRLWLRGLPELRATDLVKPVGPYCPAGTGRKDRSKYGSAKRGEDAKNRSKTFPGVAKAMAEQWVGEADG